MSSFASKQDNPPQELSPEASARKLEKIRMNRLKQKEKKRLKNLAEKGDLPPSAVSIGESSNRQSSGVRPDSSGSRSSSMIKNFLSIAPLAAEGSHILATVLLLVVLSN